MHLLGYKDIPAKPYIILNQLSPRNRLLLSNSNSFSVWFQTTKANGWEIHGIYKWERSQGACTAGCSIAVLFGDRKLNRRAIHIEDPKVIHLSMVYSTHHSLSQLMLRVSENVHCVKDIIGNSAMK